MLSIATIIRSILSNARQWLLYPSFIALLLAGASSADARQESAKVASFERDKLLAESAFGDSQQQACLTAFSNRYTSDYQLASELSFNESLSALAYDTLYWKDSPHGLLFSGQLRHPSTQQSATLLCYYAIRQNQLDFQAAYVLPVASEKQDAAIKDAGSLVLTSLNTR